MKKIIYFSICELVEKSKIDESDVHHLIATHSLDHAHHILVGVVYGRMYAYSYTVSRRLGVPHQDFHDKYHDFICKKVCGASFPLLKEMALSADYTGTIFRHFLVSEHRKKKVHVVGNETHLVHLHSHNGHFDFFPEEEVQRYKNIIRHHFQHSDLYVAVFHLHLKGHGYEEINHELHIKNAHVIKHRIFKILKAHA